MHTTIINIHSCNLTVPCQCDNLNFNWKHVIDRRVFLRGVTPSLLYTPPHYTQKRKRWESFSYHINITDLFLDKTRFFTLILCACIMYYDMFPSNKHWSWQAGGMCRFYTVHNFHIRHVKITLSLKLWFTYFIVPIVLNYIS